MKDYLEQNVVARCVCSYTTSRHIIRDPNFPFQNLSKCQSVNQSNFLLHRRILFKSISSCAIANWLLPVVEWVSQAIFFICLTIYTVVYFISHQLLNILSSEGDADMHGTTEAFIAKHSYLSSLVPCGTFTPEPLKGSITELYGSIWNL